MDSRPSADLSIGERIITESVIFRPRWVLLLGLVAASATSSLAAEAQTEAPRETTAESPAGAHARLAEARGLMEDARHAEAIALYELLLADDVDNDEILREIGLAHRLLGDRERCVEFAQDALSIEETADAYALWGTCLLEDDKPRQAVFAYRQGLALSPEDARLSFGTATALFELGRPDEAVEILESIAGRGRPHPPSLDLLATYYAESGEGFAAVITWLRYLSSQPNSEPAARRVREILDHLVRREAKGEVAIRVVDPREIAASGLRYLVDGTVEIVLEADPESPMGFVADAQAIQCLAASVHFDPELSEFERYVGQVGALLHYLPHLRNPSTAAEQHRCRALGKQSCDVFRVIQICRARGSFGSPSAQFARASGQ